MLRHCLPTVRRQVRRVQTRDFCEAIKGLQFFFVFHLAQIHAKVKLFGGVFVFKQTYAGAFHGGPLEHLTGWGRCVLQRQHHVLSVQLDGNGQKMVFIKITYRILRQLLPIPILGKVVILRAVAQRGLAIPFPVLVVLVDKPRSVTAERPAVRGLEDARLRQGVYLRHLAVILGEILVILAHIIEHFLPLVGVQTGLEILRQRLAGHQLLVDRHPVNLLLHQGKRRGIEVKKGRLVPVLWVCLTVGIQKVLKVLAGIFRHAQRLAQLCTEAIPIGASRMAHIHRDIKQVRRFIPVQPAALVHRAAHHAPHQIVHVDADVKLLAARRVKAFFRQFDLDAGYVAPAFKGQNLP